MGLSRNEYVYSGGPQEFDLNFALGYVRKSDVTAFVKDELDGLGAQVFRNLTWINDQRVEVQGSLEPGDVVVIQRTVPKTQFFVDLENPGTATRRNLMTGYRQVMMAMHELLDGRIADTLVVEDAVAQAVSDALAQILENLQLQVVQFDQLYFGFYSPFDGQKETIVSQVAMTISTDRMQVDIAEPATSTQTFTMRNNGVVVGTITIPVSGAASLSFTGGGTTYELQPGAIEIEGPEVADVGLRFGITFNGTTNIVAYQP